MSAKVYVTVGVDKRSIPAGGLAGEFLVKASDDDYDFVWSEVSGTGAERQPSTGPSPKDTGALGIRGTSVNYARQDHQHPLNVEDDVTPMMNGTASAGDDDYYARRDHVHPSDTYSAGFILDAANIFNSVDDLPAAGTAGRIAFVKVS